jgi:hypothetical protein
MYKEYSVNKGWVLDFRSLSYFVNSKKVEVKKRPQKMAYGHLDISGNRRG